MIYVKVNDTLYPATINGEIHDYKWDNRESASIILKGDFNFVNELFQNNTPWSIHQEDIIDVTPPYLVDEEGITIHEQVDVTPEYEFNDDGNIVLGEEGNPIPYTGEPMYIKGNPLPYTGDPVYETKVTEYDKSEFCIRGDLTVHTDGTCTVKMGKLTDLEEAYEIMLGGM